MTRRRFYVPRESIQNGIACLPPDQSHHLRDVLRISKGDWVEVFDGEGEGYTGEVAWDESGVVIRNLRRLPSHESTVPLVLAAALIKSDRFEYVLQKATELGVHEIIPLNTCRSDIRIPRARMEQRCERWNRIVREASKQCGRFHVPRVRFPLEFEEMLHCEDFSGAMKLLFYERAEKLWRPTGRPITGSMVLTVGPEGGWDDSEIEQAESAGWNTFSLGSSILRAETAAIAAVSIIQYHIDLQRSDGGTA